MNDYDDTTKESDGSIVDMNLGGLVDAAVREAQRATREDDADVRNVDVDAVAEMNVGIVDGYTDIPFYPATAEEAEPAIEVLQFDSGECVFLESRHTEDGGRAALELPPKAAQSLGVSLLRAGIMAEVWESEEPEHTEKYGVADDGIAGASTDE